MVITIEGQTYTLHKVIVDTLRQGANWAIYKNDANDTAVFAAVDNGSVVMDAYFDSVGEAERAVRSCLNCWIDELGSAVDMMRQELF